jgi:glutamyl-tRNA(Gln) amidotransferase subunit D
MVKLMWVLANESDPDRVAELMRTNLCGELGRCTPNGL